MQKGGSKSGQKKEKEKEKEKESAQSAQKDVGKVPSLTSHPERVKNEHSDLIEKICIQAQSLIDTGDYNEAKAILADNQGLASDGSGCNHVKSPFDQSSKGCYA